MQKSFIKHHLKRVLSILLAVITVIGLLPMTAMANGDTGGLNPGSPGGQRPNGTDVAWSTLFDQTFMRFTLIEFPKGVVADLNTNDGSTWRAVGTPLNVVWNSASYSHSADYYRSNITWYDSNAMMFNGAGTNAPQLMGSSVTAYNAASGNYQRRVITADEFQDATGISDQQKEQMFHLNSNSWSTGWLNSDYTSMWGTDPHPVTSGNLYNVYKANDAFIYLLTRLSETGGEGTGWSTEDALSHWADTVYDSSGNPRTKYRIIIETGGIFTDPDGVRRAYTLREMLAYSLYNNEDINTQYNLIWDQATTMRNMARWMRQAKDNQFVEYPLGADGTPTGEELHSINGFREADSFVDSIQYASQLRSTIFSERRSYGLHILNPFNFEAELSRSILEVTKQIGGSISADQTFGFTVTYAAGTPTDFTAAINGVDCTNMVTETGSGLKFTLKGGETVRIVFEADDSFRCQVSEDDPSLLTSITGTGGTADTAGNRFTTTGSNAKVTFSNVYTPPPPPARTILYKRDAQTNAGVGPATFRFSSVVNGDYEFDTNENGELEALQWWDPTESVGRYIKPGEYTVTEIIPPPNYTASNEVKQIRLELDEFGDPIPAGPLVFSNLPKPGLRIVKYDRLSHRPMSGVSFDLYRDGAFIGRYETDAAGEIVLNNIEPGTYRAVEVDPGDDSHILDNSSHLEVELEAGGGIKELIFFNDVLPGMRLIKVDVSDPAKTIPGAVFEIKSVAGDYGPVEFTTNVNGEIDLSHLPEGTYIVTEKSCPGYVIDSAQRIIYLRANDTAEFVFTNTRKPSLRLVKTGADGSLLDGVTFSITPIADASRSYDRTTQNGGEILIEGLEPGIYRVVETATLPDYILDETEYYVELSPGRTAELRLSNDKRPSLTIRKTDKDTGEPVPGVTFTLRAADGATITTEATGPDGTVTVSNLLPGVYTVTEQSVPENYILDTATQTVTLFPNRNATVQFQNYQRPTLKIAKVDFNGKYLSGAVFEVKTKAGVKIGDFPVGEDGTVTIPNTQLDEGYYIITEIQAPEGYILDSTPHEVYLRPGKTTEITIVNDKKPSLTIRKTDKDTGEPVPGVTFTLQSMEGPTITTEATGPDGTVTVPDLLPGVYTVTEQSVPENYILDATPQTVTLFPNRDATVQFQNHQRPTLKIAKVDINGKYLTGAVFEVKTKAGVKIGDFPVGADGTVTIPNVQLDEGYYIITEIQAPEGYILDSTPHEVYLRPGKTTEISITNEKKPGLTIYKIDSVVGDGIKGAKFKIYVAKDNAPNGTYQELDSSFYYTDENGIIHLDNLDTGWYKIVEVEPAAGFSMKEPHEQIIYVEHDKAVEVTFENTPLNAIIVQKYDSVTGEPLAGCTFQLRYLSGTSGTGGIVIGQKVTGKNGICMWTGLEPGAYVVEEISAADGYTITNSSETVYLADNGEQSVITLTFTNAPDGSLLIRKVCAVNPSVTLQNAEFKVIYSDGTLIGNSNGIFITDENGEILITGLKPGKSVVVTEVKAPPGFIIDTQSQTIQIKEGRTVSLTFKNQPKGSLIIQKRDSQTGEVLPGAEFRITTAAGCEVGLDGVIGTSTLTSNGIFTTDSNGEIRISNLAPSAYVITEIKAPDGYVIDTPSTNVVIGTGGDTQTVVIKNTKKGGLIVEKYDSVTKQPLAGARFKITTASGELVADNEGLTSSNGLYITDVNGQIILSKLLPGTYIVTEDLAPDNYQLDPTPQTVVVNAGDTQTLRFYDDPLCTLTIMKRDAVTRKPLQGAEFTVRDSEGRFIGTYTTGSDGTVTVTGLTPNATIVVSESRAPTGYILDETPKNIVVRSGAANSLIFDNQPGTTLVIRKFIEGTDYEPLAGVCFKVTDGNGGAIGPDDGIYYTDKSGEIVLEGIEPGTTVIAREIKTVEGFVLDGTPQDILIKGGEVQHLTFWNKRAGELIIRKLDSVTGEPLAGVEFELTYAGGGYVDNANGHLSSNGLYTTDAHGEIHISGVTGTIVVKETRTIDGYTINEATRTQTVTVNPMDTQTLTFYNDPKQTLIIQKYVDGTTVPIQGVVFLVTDSSGAYVGPNNGEYVTDRNGRIVITDIVPGVTITAKEVRTVSGYVLDTTPQSILIKSGTAQTLTFFNKAEGGLELIKVNENDTTQRIPGVTFEIRRMDGGLVETVTTDENGRVHVNLDAGNYYAVEIEAAQGYKLDDMPHYFTVTDGKTTTLTVKNKPFSGILIHKTDSVTGRGIYGVTFLLYDSTYTPIGQYTSDNNGYVYIENLSKSGRYYLRELENEGYIVDTQMKTVYVTAGETTLIEWQNTPITAQIQITKKSADYNPTNGLPAGTLLEGAVFEIYDKAGNLVDTIRSDSRGVASSKPLPLGRYTIREVKAPDNYGISGQDLTAYLEHAGEIVRFEVTNKSLVTGVSITKTGPNQVMAGQPVNYTFSDIANNSNVTLTSFYWRDTLPAEVRLNTVVTGTYNFPGTYKIVYRVNGGDYRTLADNLSTSKNYTLAASAVALGLASNERVTEVMFVFGQAPAGFAQVEKPMLKCTAVAAITTTAFTNVADVGGVYNDVWIQAVSRWVTTVYKPTVPTLPKTGY